jgi:hypothetical protein
MSPNDLTWIGHTLGDVFEDDSRLFPVFRSIYDWRQHGWSWDDNLRIGGERLDEWQRENDAMRQWVEWGHDWNPARLAYFEHALRPEPAAMTSFYQRLMRQLAVLQRRVPEGEIHAMLSSVDSLCEAARQTGYPVEFIW